MTSPVLPSALTTTTAANSARASHIKEPIDQHYTHDSEQQSAINSPSFSLVLPQLQSTIDSPPLSMILPQQQNTAATDAFTAQIAKPISTLAAPLASETLHRTNAMDLAINNAMLGQENTAKPLHFANSYTSAVNPFTQPISLPTAETNGQPLTQQVTRQASILATETSGQPLTNQSSTAANDRTHKTTLATNFANASVGSTFNRSAVKSDGMNPLLSSTQLATALIAKQVDNANMDATDSAHQILTANTRAHSAVAQWGPVSVSQAAPMLQQAHEMLSPLREQLRFQIDQQIKQAELRLDPPELGKIELNIRLDGDKLHIQMHAANAAVRDALLTGLDRLRAELAADHGGQIDVDISQGESQQKQTQQGSKSAIAAANQQGAQPMTADTSQQDQVDLLA
ncbi:MAG: flagellar hook-length control protein FliK [Shewanella sp.]|jgi:flagellar hook-length control protein FliK